MSGGRHRWQSKARNGPFCASEGRGLVAEPVCARMLCTSILGCAQDAPSSQPNAAMVHCQLAERVMHSRGVRTDMFNWWSQVLTLATGKRLRAQFPRPCSLPGRRRTRLSTRASNSRCRPASMRLRKSSTQRSLLGSAGFELCFGALTSQCVHASCRSRESLLRGSYRSVDYNYTVLGSCAFVLGSR